MAKQRFIFQNNTSDQPESTSETKNTVEENTTIEDIMKKLESPKINCI